MSYLGGLCWRHAHVVILLWLLASLAAAVVATRLGERLVSGSGDIAGSVSLRVDQRLWSDFGRSDSRSLILVIHSASIGSSSSQLSTLLDALGSRLKAQPSVESIITERELQDAGLLPDSASGHLIIINLNSADLLAAEQEVPKIRAIVRPLLSAAKASHGDLDWAVTGRAALTYDLNQFTAADAAQAEITALPLTLIILIFAFGSVISAMLPLLLALASRTVALGLLFFLATTVDLSNFVQSVVTMLSIALGIDYSLFIIHRYRQELKRIGSASVATRESQREMALRTAMAQSGSAVFYSAVTVAIGIGSLIATPLLPTQSIGLSGLFAVLVTLMASLTMVPASLRLLRPRLLEWPALLSRENAEDRSRKRWLQWAEFIEKQPVLAIVSSVAVLLAMAAPALNTRVGFPESEFLPAELEFSRGMAMLDGMQLEGLVSPIAVLVSDTRKERALNPERVPILTEFVSQLETDPRVEFVQGPVKSTRNKTVDVGPERGATIEDAMSGALSRSAFVSHDGSRLLFLIIPTDGSTLNDLRSLSGTIPASLEGGLAIEVGGQAQYYNDFENAMSVSYRSTLGLVLGMSAFVLLLVFRAPLTSAKAIFLNLLSVAAGYGIVVLVFQLGHGSELFGVAAPTSVVPVFVPLVMFCILFGLSMDYEIFFLSRVRTIFFETTDNALSIREGLADTGSVITSAALIMVVVFGAFAFARDIVVQMIGLGLATAVLVDAILIRSMLGPALMQIAGRWNWWPGSRQI